MLSATARRRITTTNVAQQTISVHTADLTFQTAVVSTVNDAYHEGGSSTLFKSCLAQPIKQRSASPVIGGGPLSPRTKFHPWRQRMMRGICHRGGTSFNRHTNEASSTEIRNLAFLTKYVENVQLATTSFGTRSRAQKMDRHTIDFLLSYWFLPLLRF
jgi:hypothetical protein